MAAAFSAIIRVGELVLPDVMVGITEASATRRPCEAAHLQPGIDDGGIVAAHPAGADGVEDGGGDVAGGLGQLLVALDLEARAELLGSVLARATASRRCCA